MASAKHVPQLSEALTLASLTDKQLYTGWSVIRSSMFNSLLHIASYELEGGMPLARLQLRHHTGGGERD